MSEHPLIGRFAVQVDDTEFTVTVLKVIADLGSGVYLGREEEPERYGDCPITFNDPDVWYRFFDTNKQARAMVTRMCNDDSRKTILRVVPMKEDK